LLTQGAPADGRGVDNARKGIANFFKGNARPTNGQPKIFDIGKENCSAWAADEFAGQHSKAAKCAGCISS
jgi:hypothetical protein